MDATSFESITAQHQELATQYTSEVYGIIWGQEHVDTLAFLSYMIKVYEEYLPHVHPRDLGKLFLFLGHWNLLLNNFPKALSAYAVAVRKDKKLIDDPYYLFGIGLVYFYYGSYSRALDSFQRLIRVSSTFPRKADVILRIAVIFKHFGASDLSEKYYKMIACPDYESIPLFCALSRPEILISYAHLFQTQGGLADAKSVIEEIVRNPMNIQNVNPLLRLRLMKQLVCLLDRLPLEEARQLLNDSNDFVERLLQLCQPSDPMMFYYAGRCTSFTNRINETFFKYRSCVDRMQNGADVWCSIGNLYQHQNQIQDSHQAYACSLQIKPDHFESWVNIGSLYESVNQLKDAICAYRQACEHCKDEDLKLSLLKRSTILRALQSTTVIPLNASQTLEGIGPNGLPISVASHTYRQLAPNSVKDEVRFPFDQPTIQIVRAAVDRRCSQISSPSQLAVLPVDAVLPYVRQTGNQTRQSCDVPTDYFEGPLLDARDEREFGPDPASPSEPAVLFRQADPNNPDLVIPDRCVMWFQYGQVFKVRLHCVSSGQLVAHCASQFCTVVTHPSDIAGHLRGKPSPALRLQCKRVITTFLQFARYQASSCVRLTSGCYEGMPANVSWAELFPVPPDVDLYLKRVLPECIRPEQTNNLLSYAQPYGKPSVYVFVPGVRLPVRMRPFTEVYLNIGPGEIHWSVVEDRQTVRALNELMKASLGVDCFDGTDDLWLDAATIDRCSSVIQRPGDLLIVSPDSMHWATSLAWSNCLKWSIARFSDYRAMKRDYGYGDIRMKRRPTVPIYRLSLTLARECLITDVGLFEQVQETLSKCSYDQSSQPTVGGELRCLLCEQALIGATMAKRDPVCEVCKLLFPQAELPPWRTVSNVLAHFRLFIPLLNFKSNY